MFLYGIPNKSDLSFVVHELVIHAVEAMQQISFTVVKEFEVHVVKEADVLKITVTDEAMGIPENQWDCIFNTTFEQLDYSDRGR